MTTHDLKTHPQFFEPVFSGQKLFELRRNDRDFKEGDWLKLREWAPADIVKAKPAGYTARTTMRKIAYVLKGGSTAGLVGLGETIPLLGDWVILGLEAPLTALGCQHNGREMYLATTDRKLAEECAEFLVNQNAFVEREASKFKIQRERKLERERKARLEGGD
tara:strand:- start:38883 stop:39371 length:489 start_codon:yes stop_codon:yes gene_type:complete